MVSVTLKAKVDCMDSEVNFEFGKVQANMDISARGKAARKLKLKEGDNVEVTIKKV